MVHYARLQIRRERAPSLNEVEEARASVFFDKLKATLDDKKFKPHDAMVDRLLDQGHTSTDIASALIHLLQSPAAEAEKAVKPVAEPAKEYFSDKPGRRDFGGTGKPSSAPSKFRSPAPSSGPSSAPAPTRPSKAGFDRKPRTGREPGFATVALNVGRDHFVLPADIVGKIAGVTRLPSNIVGAIDIHGEHTHVDVRREHADIVVQKLDGVRIKNQTMRPSLLPPSAS